LEGKVLAFDMPEIGETAAQRAEVRIAFGRAVQQNAEAPAPLGARRMWPRRRRARKHPDEFPSPDAIAHVSIIYSNPKRFNPAQSPARTS
ncbi:MAG TPA: hypothetical protein VIF14_12990, partial [Alphaproteobacteria bacterium]